MWKSDLPSVISAGTTVKWRDESATVPINESATSSDWDLIYYLRTNTAGEGHISVGSAFNSGWEFTIAASDTTNFDAGDWFWCAIVNKGSEKYKLGQGSLIVKQKLEYSGTPGAIDYRTQAETDLDNISAAIRAIVTDKAKEYTIGDRTFKRLDLPVLIARESQLKSIVKSEKRASLISQGLGDPKNLYVRF
jgi:hypothetical protein|tara:strand:- start:246 stop:821 length:576 start_codon:yes stop_codon:yes gene_type:complete